MSDATKEHKAIDNTMNEKISKIKHTLESSRPLISAKHQAGTGIKSSRSGLTMPELVISMATSLIVIMTAGLLVHSGYRNFNRVYESANNDTRVGTLNSMIALGAIGRKSNRMNYCLYNVDGGKFEKVLPSNAPEEVVTGQAVEFRYWDEELDAELVNPDTTATAYALFYLDDDNALKIDFGPYPPGGVDAYGQKITNSQVTTVTLVRHLTSVEFSHTTRNMKGDGKGCVRMKLITTDPVDGSTKTALAATLMRNAWPQ